MADKLLSCEPELEVDPDPKSKSPSSAVGVVLVGEGKGREGELTIRAFLSVEEGEGRTQGNGWGVVGDLASDQAPDPSDAESKLILLFSSLLRLLSVSLRLAPSRMFSKPFFLLRVVVGEDLLLPNQEGISDTRIFLSQALQFTWLRSATQRLRHSPRIISTQRSP